MPALTFIRALEALATRLCLQRGHKLLSVTLVPGLRVALKIVVSVELSPGRIARLTYLPTDTNKSMDWLSRDLAVMLGMAQKYTPV